jgi:hypothetical protein
MRLTHKVPCNKCAPRNRALNSVCEGEGKEHPAVSRQYIRDSQPNRMTATISACRDVRMTGASRRRGVVGYGYFPFIARET